MKQMAASRFKAQCLSILDRVDEQGLVITKHGRAVARLTAFREVPIDLIGALAGQIKIRGDIMSTGIVWNTQS